MNNVLLRGGIALGLVAGVATSVPALAASADVTVSSEVGWQPTPLELRAGQSFTVEYRSGTWTVGNGGLAWVGLDGYDAAADQQIYQGCKILTGLTYGHLLARTGGSAPFVIARSGTFAAPAAGRLELRINDQDHCLGDNAGAIDVRVGTDGGAGPTSPTGSASTTSPAGPTSPTDSGTGPASPMKLYAADWSAGFNGWGSDSSWKTLRGHLLNDGTSGDSNIFGPYGTGAVVDYAVEARIRVVEAAPFGIVIRHSASEPGYVAALDRGGTRLGAGDSAYSATTVADGHAFSPGTDWHTYRIEADGNVLRFLIDGALFATATDNKYLSGGSAGLSSRYAQIEVSSFTILRLH